MFVVPSLIQQPALLPINHTLLVICFYSFFSIRSLKRVRPCAKHKQNKGGQPTGKNKPSIGGKPQTGHHAPFHAPPPQNQQCSGSMIGVCMLRENTAKKGEERENVISIPSHDCCCCCCCTAQPAGHNIEISPPRSSTTVHFLYCQYHTPSN